MGDKDLATLALALASLLVAARGVMIAVKTLRHNARTKSAEFLMQLHQSFFVEDHYEEVREVIDSSDPAAKELLKGYTRDEPPHFINFLNFFELVVSFRQNKVLRKQEIESLLGYYLNLLSRSPELRKYIANRDKHFEQLDAYLANREVRERQTR